MLAYHWGWEEILHFKSCDLREEHSQELGLECKKNTIPVLFKLLQLYGVMYKNEVEKLQKKNTDQQWNVMEQIKI